jgi:hypothetical protein
MISGDIFLEMALSFPETEAKPHFERTGIKVTGRRMFTTYLAENNTANIFLTPEDQYLFCKINAQYIYPVPNKWGLKGATTFELNHLPKKIVKEALSAAYKDVVRTK